MLSEVIILSSSHALELCIISSDYALEISMLSSFLALETNSVICPCPVRFEIYLLAIDWTSGRWLLAGLHFALCFNAPVD